MNVPQLFASLNPGDELHIPVRQKDGWLVVYTRVLAKRSDGIHLSYPTRREEEVISIPYTDNPIFWDEETQRVFSTAGPLAWDLEKIVVKRFTPFAPAVQSPPQETTALSIPNVILTGNEMQNKPDILH